VEKLLRTFGSLERIRQTTDQDLTRVVGKAAATRIRAFLDQNNAPSSFVQIASAPESESLHTFKQT
jgi:ERCC4-type nuclease